MANYVTVDDVSTRLRKNFEPLYSPRGLTGSDTDCVEQDIAAAEADLHSYLATRYVTPVTDGDAMALCKAWTLTLIEELAYSLGAPGRDMPKGVETRVAALRTRLERIQEGHGSLGTATEIEETDRMDDAIIIDGPDPVFKRDNMEGF